MKAKQNALMWASITLLSLLLCVMIFAQVVSKNLNTQTFAHFEFEKMGMSNRIYKVDSMSDHTIFIDGYAYPKRGSDTYQLQVGTFIYPASGKFNGHFVTVIGEVTNLTKNYIVYDSIADSYYLAPLSEVIITNL